MEKQGLALIPKLRIRTGVERLDIFRLGKFNGKMHEIVELKAGQRYPPHKHEHATSRLHVICGNGVATVGTTSRRYKKGDVILIRKGTWHGFSVQTTTLMLSIQSGKPITSRDGTKVDIAYKPS